MGMVIDDALPTLLDGFYDNVRSDAVLGPICQQAPGEWPAELQPLADLWPALMRMSSPHESMPIPHPPRSKFPITLPMFERWVSLWRATVVEMLPRDGAMAMQVRAARMSVGLQRALGLRMVQA